MFSSVEKSNPWTQTLALTSGQTAERVGSALPASPASTFKLLLLGDLCTSLVQPPLSHINLRSSHVPPCPCPQPHITLLQVLTYLSAATIHKEVLQP